MPGDAPQTTGLSYPAAMARLQAGAKIRRAAWNDESHMVLRDGAQVMVLGGRISTCQPRDSETLKWDWQVVP